MDSIVTMCRDRLRALAAVLGFTALLAVPADAQLAHASASTLGMAGNNTALVRGFGAISVNPAGLGMPGSGFSLALAPVQGRIGSAPVTVGDIYDFQGVVVPDVTKQAWLQRVIAAGGQSGRAGADATAFALTVGNVGFQISTTASSDFTLPPGLMEAYLFGNGGRTGEPSELSLVGASIQSFALTTAAMSFALPINERLSFGMTGKYVFGHGLVVGRSQAGAIEVDPIRAVVDLPVVTSCVDELDCEQDFVKGGSGFGLDFGAMVDLGLVTVGASVQNLVNSFMWDETKLGYRPGVLVAETGDFTTEFDEAPYGDAPADLRAIVSDYTLKPTFRLGAALDLTSMLTVTGDIHGRFADTGIAVDPDYATGVGAELRLGFVHLRGGLTKMNEGMQYGAGTSLVLGPVNLSLAGGLVRGDMHDAALAQFGLSFGNR